ncbi:MULTISPECIES: heparin/heparin-sulfate lyase HepB [unclassified Janthinobacterium]|uniref:heparin/heparin-sulfate lyase HepB n=1 Tax=unclassified Janthinobacterium TaxID=2610881 RepID=UPI0012F85414|nr:MULTISPECIES: heparin/heparin-sulfate lyase HepB [unclassified Janthinobacterium]MEC5161549.1 hypothetical protein [Janthinobacterium sp. CG_S6]
MSIRTRCGARAKLLPLLISAGLASHAALGASIPFQTEFMIEAEDGTKSASSGWLEKTGAGASNQRFMQAPPEYKGAQEAGTPGELSYQVLIPAAGTYKIWLRMLATSATSNSLFLAVEDDMGSSAFSATRPPKVDGDWKWFYVERVLKAGVNTIKLDRHMGGAGIDRLMVSSLPAFVASGMGTSPGIPAIVPPAGHPRLFARNSDLDRLRSQMAHPEIKPAWERMEKIAGDAIKVYPEGNLPLAEAGKSNYKKELLVAIKRRALDYLLYGNQMNGALAVTLMENNLKTVRFTADTREKGDTILTSAMVYDWCYPLMTAAQRTYFIERFKTIAPTMEIGYPPIKQGSLVGHGSEAQLMRDQLSAGVAFYDEDPTIYQIVAGRFFAEFIEARHFSYQAQSHHQGLSYGPVRYMADLYAAWIFRRMGAGDVFDPLQQMTPYHWLYMRRPDGQMMRDGDIYQSAYMRYGQYWSEPIAYLLPASYYNDPVLKQELAQQLSVVEQTTGFSVEDDIWYLLFGNTQLIPQTSPKNLPLTKYFPDPAGIMVARTGWENGVKLDSGTAIASMKIGNVQYRNHQHLDAGQFQFYYKGSLASASGIYSGKSTANGVPGSADGTTSLEYGSTHDKNYYKRTIAHNALLVLDPSEEFLGSANDGGQRWVSKYEPFSLPELLNLPHPDTQYNSDQRVDNSSVVASVLRHQFGPDAVKPEFSYLKGDLTNAYTSKVSEVKRSFVFLNLNDPDHPAALIVFDKLTSSNSAFTKTWLLHTQAEPQITGDTVTVLRTGNGYNGKLVNRTLLPAADNTAIVKVGGPGREYLVGDTNYAIFPNHQLNTEEAGSWRVEVSPKTKAGADTFLNVMQVMDAKVLNMNGTVVGEGPPPFATAAIVSEQMSGVTLKDRAVLFAKDGADITDTASFVLPPSPGGMKVLVTDLTPGIWTVGKAGDSATVQYEVQPDEGTVYFVASTGGTYVLQRGSATVLH